MKTITKLNQNQVTQMLQNYNLFNTVKTNSRKVKSDYYMYYNNSDSILIIHKNYKHEFLGATLHQ